MTVEIEEIKVVDKRKPEGSTNCRVRSWGAIPVVGSEGRNFRSRNNRIGTGRNDRTIMERARGVGPLGRKKARPPRRICTAAVGRICRTRILDSGFSQASYRDPAFKIFRVDRPRAYYITYVYI